MNLSKLSSDVRTWEATVRDRAAVYNRQSRKVVRSAYKCNAYSKKVLRRLRGEFIAPVYGCHTADDSVKLGRHLQEHFLPKYESDVVAQQRLALNKYEHYLKAVVRLSEVRRDYAYQLKGSRFACLHVDELDIPEQEIVPEIYEPAPVRKVIPKIDEFIQVTWEGVPESPAPTRDATLASKLRVIITLFEMQRKRGLYLYKFCLKTGLPYVANIFSLYNDFIAFHRSINAIDYSKMMEMDSQIASDYARYWEVAQSEMERPDEPVATTVDQTSNVIVTNDAATTHAQPIEIQPGIWRDLATTSTSQDYGELMTRQHKFLHFEWSKDHPIGMNLININNKDYATLPYTFVKMYPDAPGAILFKTYAYWSGDIEIKVQLTSNAFQCGSLQASFYYGATFDKYYKDRDNVGCASQMAHCIISAGASNEGILSIPYRYYKPWVSTRIRDDDVAVLDIGRLRIKVLNMLNVPDSQPSTCTVNVFISFKNSKFSGMLSRGLGSSEMFSMRSLVDATNVVANSLNQIYPDPQRDNPPDVFPIKPLVPQSAQSWCVGDSLSEPINPLRLQATGQTPHPPGSLPSEPEMTIDYLKRIYGLIETLTWSRDSHEGVQLRVYPASPIMRFDQYFNVRCSNPNPYSCAVLPPVSTIAEMFAYWRGSIELKLDFVTSQYHTGKLIIAYIPRLTYKQAKEATFDQLLDCDHVIIDIKETKEHVYKQSFISDKPFWTRRAAFKNSSEQNPPGHIVIAINNMLTAPDTVAKHIDINVYLRGGDDLTFAVPVQPNIGLSFNTNLVIPPTNEVTYLEAYGPPADTIGLGPWRYIGGGTRALLRYGSGSDHVVQFGYELKYRTVYKLSSTISISHPEIANNIPLKFLARVPDPQNIVDYYVYATLFDTYDNARKYSSSYNPNAVSVDDKIDFSKIPKITKDGNYQYYNKRIYWVAVSSCADSDPEWDCAEQEMDQRQSDEGLTLDIHGSLTNKYASNLVFGETFNDLRQLTRRYQFYGAYISAITDKSDPSVANATIPLLPQGLDLVPEIAGNQQYFANQCRDGIIPIICSGYRFFRGGMRIRLIIGSEKLNAYVWVQHKPDIHPTNGRISVTQAANTRYLEGLINHGYATLFQGLAINGIVSVEVPYYLPGQFGLLQRPDFTVALDSIHYSLGSLVVSVDGMAQKNKVSMYILYSHADDMSLSVFQGFPPMIFLDPFREITPAKAEMLSIKKTLNGWTDKITNKVVERKVEEITEALKETEVAEGAKKIMDNPLVVKLAEDFANEVNIDKAAIARMISQIVHVCISPKIETMVWSFLNCFVELGLVAFGWLNSMKDILVRYFSKVINTLSGKIKSKPKPTTTTTTNSLPSTSGQPPNKTDQGGVAKAEMNVEDLDLQAAAMSTCITGMLAALQISPKAIPRNIPDFTSMLWYKIPRFAYNSNCLFRFFKNNLFFFRRIYDWLFSFFMPDRALAKELAGQNETIKELMTSINWCLDARNKEEILNNPVAHLRLYECANLAQRLLMDMSINAENYAALTTIRGMCVKVCTLRDEISRKIATPSVRFEPWVIGVAGTSGIGKSFIASGVTKDLLKSIGYASYQKPMYTRTPGNAYWNNLANEPCIYYDDFLQLDTGEPAQLQLAELFMLKSKAIFNPPMAAIEDKVRCINPLMVYLSSNKSFPQIHGISQNSAWHRRRDILWIAKPNLTNSDVKNAYNAKKDVLDMKKIPNEVKKEMNHVRFYLNNDTTKEDYDVQAPFTYKEFLERSKEEFRKYFLEEIQNYNTTINELKTLYPKDELEFQMTLKIDQSRFFDEARKIIDSRADNLDEINEQRQYIGLCALKNLNIYSLTSKEEAKALKEQSESLDFLAKAFVTIRNMEVADQTSEQKELLTKVTKYINEEADPSVKDKLNKFIDHYAKSMKASAVKDKTKISKLTAVASKAVGKNKGKSKSTPVAVDPLSSLVNSAKLTVSPSGEAVITAPEVEEGEIAIEVAKSEMLTVEEDHCECCNLMQQNPEFNVDPVTHSPFIRKNYFGAPHYIGSVCDELNGVTNECCYSTICNRFWKYAYNHLILMANQKITPVMRSNMDKYRATLKSNPVTVKYRTNEEILADLNSQKTFFEKIWEKIPSWKTIWWILAKIGAFLALISLVFMAFSSVISSFSGVKQSMFESNMKNEAMSTCLTDPTLKADLINRMTSTGEMPSSGASLTASAKVLGNYIQTAKSQASAEINTAVAKKLIRNTFWIRAVTTEEDGSKKQYIAKCIGLCGHNFIALDHYYLKFGSLPRDRTQFEYVNNSCVIPLNYLSVRNICLKNSAIVISRLPPQMAQFKDIRQFIIPQRNTANMGRNSIIFDYCFDNSTHQFVMKEYQLQFDVTDTLVVDNESVHGDTLVERLLRYKKHYSGMCGSVVVADWNTPAPILGIHIAGQDHSGFGYAEGICAESFNDVMLNDFDRETTLVDSLKPVDKATLQMPTNVTSLGAVRQAQAIRSANKSRLVHTECAGQITPITYDWPLLNPKDPRIANDPFSPMVHGCLNHGDILKDFPSSVMEIAYKDLRGKILAKVVPMRQKVGVLDYSSVVVGVPGLKGYDKLDFDTSEGFPLVKERPKHAVNKKWLFDLEETKEGYNLKSIHPKLIEILEHKDNLRKNNVIPETVFVNCLKDHKMPIEKACVRGKTRIFGVSPIDYTIQSRQYFLDFSVAYQEARFVTEHSIGIDINSIEATELVNTLMGKGFTKLVTGDYSKFGDTLLASCVYYAYKIMIDWYELHEAKCEESNYRWVLAYEVIHSLHLMHDLVYQTHCGMPSGNPLTVIINSLVNSLYLRCAWQIIMSQQAPRLMELRYFNEYCVPITYGDDLIMSVSDTVSEIYNTVTIAACFADYRIKFTDATKSGQMRPYYSLHEPEASFLKHTFRKHPTRAHLYIAKLDDRAMKEICNWCWNTNLNSRDNALEACKAMMENAYGHGPEEYESLLTKVQNYWISQNVHFPFPSWEEIDERIHGSMVRG